MWQLILFFLCGFYVVSDLEEMNKFYKKWNYFERQKKLKDHFEQK